MDKYVTRRKPDLKGAVSHARAAKRRRDASAVTPPILLVPVTEAACDVRRRTRNMARDALEDELELFDMDGRFGPFVAMERLARWERAEKWNLSPPQSVRDILQNAGTNGVRSLRYGGLLW